MTKEQLDFFERRFVDDSHIQLDDIKELIRLARLGLWAEEHMEAIKCGLYAGDRFYYGHPKYNAALAALPEGKP